MSKIFALDGEDTVNLYKYYGNYPTEQEFLSENPVKSSYKTVEHSFNGRPGFCKRLSCFILPHYDQIKEISLRISLKNVENGQDCLSLSDIINRVEYESGNWRIQCYNGSFLECLGSLEGKNFWYFENKNDETLFHVTLPINFHQYRLFPLSKDVKFRLNIEFNQKPYPNIEMESATCLVKYSESPNFQNNMTSSSMLWEMIQFHHESIPRNTDDRFKVRLYFNNPGKVLIWNFYAKDSKKDSKFKLELPILESAQIFVNNHELTPRLPASFLNTIMPSKFRKDLSELDIDPNLYCYSFCEDPTSAGPNGTIDFSANDNIYLDLYLNEKNISTLPEGVNIECNIYVISYNIYNIPVGRVDRSYVALKFNV